MHAHSLTLSSSCFSPQAHRSCCSPHYSTLHGFWSHGPARLFLTRGFSFFLPLFPFTYLQDAAMKKPVSLYFLDSWLPPALWVWPLPAWGKTLFHCNPNKQVCSDIIISRLQYKASWMQTAHSWLQHFSLCVRGSSCLWKWLFLPRLYKGSITDVQMNIYIILSLLQKYCVRIQEITFAKKTVTVKKHGNVA